MSEEAKTENKNEQSVKKEEVKTELPAIQFVIDSFLHRILDIEDCAIQYVSAASKNYNDKADLLKEQIDQSRNTLQNEEDGKKKLLAMKGLRKTLRDIERHNSSSPVETLEKSLFINLFAAFDKYIGDIVTTLYKANPSLYNNLNREIKLSEAIAYKSMDDLREAVLDKEVESIRRKSYVEQFKDLENKFSLPLTKFDSWAYFIERAQRRNLFTHCDGIVSKQYLETCKEVGYKSKKERKVGDQLEIGAEYFYLSCYLVAEVGVMLGQTLWRKTVPDEIDKADSHLSRLIFDYLHMEHWRNAIGLSKFALNLPKISSETIERIFTVNYAIALSAIDEEKAAINILSKKDWSVTSYDFRLAHAILTKNYSKAKEFMIKIGKDGELISELAYHDWPLFRDFRDRDEFLLGYEAVYGYKYSSKLSELAEDKKIDINESEISKKDIEINDKIVH